LYFTQSNWDTILDNLYAAGSEERLLGTAVINGVTYDSVGVRYKGNSSYSGTRVKNPFNIKLDYIKGDQLLEGKYGTIKLADGFCDPSFVRETLSYEIARKYMPAGKANYANVYVNNTLIGLYTNVQDVDSYFMKDQLHCSGKPRFKCDTNTMSTVTVWGYLGADSTAYQTYYGLESDYGWASLINFTNVLNNSPSNIETVMNVDQNLWMCAFDNLLVSLDSPINIFHNFYLFGDNNNRINPILWDLNMSFGGFNQGMTTSSMQNMDPLRNSTSTTFTLLSKILSTARYKKMYIAHMRTMLTENFSNGWYSTRASELQAICGPSVQADPNKFYTYANFTANLTSTVTGGSGGPGGGSICGITQLMGTRVTYLLASSAFSGTVPTISSITYSPTTVLPNSTVTFKLTATNATYAHLGIRQNIANKFIKYQMYDDGAHGDGAAGDGVYGITVNIGYGEVEYYGYAENSSQAVFYPARAEHEFLTIPVASESGELIVNEINYNAASSFDPGDWIEIYNPSTSAINIASWYLRDDDNAHKFTFPTGTTIAGNGYLVVCRDHASFISRFPTITNSIGDMSFGLSSGGDAVRLYKSTGITVDSVAFGASSPWPTTPNGGGPTLELSNPTLDNTLAASWVASLGHGTPGKINSGLALSTEPTAHVTSFHSYDTTYYGTTLGWTGSTGILLPTGYLIKGSYISPDSIIVPVDGTPETDDVLVKNVAYGTETAVFDHLKENRTVYFKIYPYAGSDTGINYKTVTPPSLTLTTSTGPTGSTLSAGDIVFIEYGTDAPDRFAFLLLRDVAENTIIHFTDRAWTGSAFALTEDSYDWRAVGRAYHSGEVVRVISGSMLSVNGIFEPDFDDFSNDGDQLLAYQGADSSPTFIAGISTTNWITSGTVTNYTSYLPSTLTIGSNAISFALEMDNGYYDGSLLQGSAYQIRTAVCNAANWTRSLVLDAFIFPSNSYVVTEGYVTGLQISKDGNNIHLSWSAYAGAAYYIIYGTNVPPQDSKSEDWSVIQANVTTTSVTISAAALSGNTKFFKITAYQN